MENKKDLLLKEKIELLAESTMDDIFTVARIIIKNTLGANRNSMLSSLNRDEINIYATKLDFILDNITKEISKDNIGLVVNVLREKLSSNFITVIHEDIDAFMPLYYTTDLEYVDNELSLIVGNLEDEETEKRNLFISKLDSRGLIEFRERLLNNAIECLKPSYSDKEALIDDEPCYLVFCSCNSTLNTEDADYVEVIILSVKKEIDAVIRNAAKDSTKDLLSLETITLEVDINSILEDVNKAKKHDKEKMPTSSLQKAKINSIVSEYFKTFSIVFSNPLHIVNDISVWSAGIKSFDFKVFKIVLKNETNRIGEALLAGLRDVTAEDSYKKTNIDIFNKKYTLSYFTIKAIREELEDEE